MLGRLISTTWKIVLLVVFIVLSRKGYYAAAGLSGQETSTFFIALLYTLFIVLFLTILFAIPKIKEKVMLWTLFPKSRFGLFLFLFGFLYIIFGLDQFFSSTIISGNEIEVIRNIILLAVGMFIVGFIFEVVARRKKPKTL